MGRKPPSLFFNIQLYATSTNAPLGRRVSLLWCAAVIWNSSSLKRSAVRVWGLPFQQKVPPCGYGAEKEIQQPYQSGLKAPTGSKAGEASGWSAVRAVKLTVSLPILTPHSQLYSHPPGFFMLLSGRGLDMRLREFPCFSIILWAGDAKSPFCWPVLAPASPSLGRSWSLKVAGRKGSTREKFI